MRVWSVGTTDDHNRYQGPRACCRIGGEWNDLESRRCCPCLTASHVVIWIFNFAINQLGTEIRASYGCLFQTSPSLNIRKGMIDKTDELKTFREWFERMDRLARSRVVQFIEFGVNGESLKSQAPMSDVKYFLR